MAAYGNVFGIIYGCRLKNAIEFKIMMRMHDFKNVKAPRQRVSSEQAFS